MEGLLVVVMVVVVLVMVLVLMVVLRKGMGGIETNKGVEKLISVCR